MSLDVDLVGPEETVECQCSTCDHAHTRTTRRTYFSANITHNLNRMADEAGIYLALWRPEEMLAPDIALVLKDAEEEDYHGEQAQELRRQLPTAYARDLIEPICRGLSMMKADPNRFIAFDSPNGWGLYKDFVPWIERYLAACEEHPDARVEVSR